MDDFKMPEGNNPDSFRIPAWFRKEPPVEILEDSHFGLYCDNDEIGIQQTDYSMVEFVNSEAAFLFGQSPDELYFRVNFSAVIKIPCGHAEERKVCEKLYTKPTAAFRDYRGMTATTFHGIAIYRDALAMLPMGPSADAEPSEEKAFPPPVAAIVLDAGGEKEQGCQGELFSEQTLEIGEEIQSAIDAELLQRQGRLYGRYCMYGGRAYDFDIASIGNRLFVIVHDNAVDTWLADEEFFGGSPPLWFSETDHRPSSVNQAQRCRDFIQKSVPAVSVVAMVVLGAKVHILNEDEMHDSWREKCHVHVVRTQQDEYSQLPTLHDCLSALSGAEAEAATQDVESMQSIAQILERNPMAWEDQTSGVPTG